MNVISFRKLKEFYSIHPDAEQQLRRWYKIAANSDWQSLAETKQDFPSADLVGECTVFNIKGND